MPDVSDHFVLMNYVFLLTANMHSDLPPFKRTKFPPYIFFPDNPFQSDVRHNIRKQHLFIFPLLHKLIAVYCTLDSHKQMT